MRSLQDFSINIVFYLKIEVTVPVAGHAVVNDIDASHVLVVLSDDIRDGDLKQIHFLYKKLCTVQ